MWKQIENDISHKANYSHEQTTTVAAAAAAMPRPTWAAAPWLAQRPAGQAGQGVAAAAVAATGLFYS